MKQFTFSLERMQNYKEQVLSKEKTFLSHLMNEKRRLQEQIQTIIQQKKATWHKLQKKQMEGIMVGELQSYQFMLQNMTHQLRELTDSLEVAEHDVAEQQAVVVMLSQELSGLEKLEEKQREEHRVLEQKEWELEISEQVARTMIKKKKL